MTRAPAVVEAAPRAFPAASDGSDVVPGRVSRVLEAAEQLDEIADGLLKLAAIMQRMSPRGWRGRAARAFVSALQLDWQPVGRAGAVMSQAAEHLRCHASVLDRAQRHADDAVRADLQASRVTTQWAIAGAPGTDPMAATRAQLNAQLVADRAAVRASGADCAQALRRCRDLAPQPRPWWQRPTHSLRLWQGDVGLGELKAVSGLLATALTFNTNRALLDPVGYGHDVATQVNGAARLATHPGDLVRSVLDLDTWHDSRQIWAGAVLPGVAVALATDNPFATTKLSSFRLQARAALPTADGRALRATMADTSRFSRSGLRAGDVRPYASEPSELGTVTRLDPVSSAVANVTRRDARFGERLVTARVESMAGGLGGVRVKPETVLKDETSLNRKFAGELAKSPAPTPTRIAATVNDCVRYTIVYPDAVYAEKSVRTVEGLRAAGFGLVKAKSTWDGPRYRGLNLTLHDPASGRLFEVQTHTPDSFQAGEDTHDRYKLFRDVGVRPLHKHQLEREIGWRYQQVPTPPGVRDLPLLLDRFGIDAPAESTAPTKLSLDGRRLALMSAGGTAGYGAGRGPVPPDDPR
ncbi:putative T7SS-secreted protein [Angustibacter sp. McL0619]|uniref:putative T7SS-secreted protein n=1 Tax=Angustibacter sp. McL0619 TaxID=3415676 RepID=UPI003CEA9256